MLERLAGNEISTDSSMASEVTFQSQLDPKDQIKDHLHHAHTELLDYRRMPFGLCNATGTFQRVDGRSSDMMKKRWEVFMACTFRSLETSFSTWPIPQFRKAVEGGVRHQFVFNMGKKAHFMVKDG
ncbi:hypothetical protein Tco_1524078 [Tanacetum coccineum]